MARRPLLRYPSDGKPSIVALLACLGQDETTKLLFFEAGVVALVVRMTIFSLSAASLLYLAARNAADNRKDGEERGTKERVRERERERERERVRDTDRESERELELSL